MKIGITGHTSGIGKALYNFYEKNNIVIGFSRSNGYNISDIEARSKIITNVLDCDIFINNAYNNYDNSQLCILQEIHKAWQNTDRIIVNISSRWTTENNKYSITKKAQDDFCQQHQYDLPKIVNIKPGLTDTDRVSDISGKKMSVESVVKIVDFAIKNNIQSITFGL